MAELVVLHSRNDLILETFVFLAVAGDAELFSLGGVLARAALGASHFDRFDRSSTIKSSLQTP